MLFAIFLTKLFIISSQTSTRAAAMALHYRPPARSLSVVYQCIKELCAPDTAGSWRVSNYVNVVPFSWTVISKLG